MMFDITDLTPEAKSLLSTFTMPKTITYHDPSHCPKGTLKAYQELIAAGFLEDQSNSHTMIFKGVHGIRDAAIDCAKLLMAGGLPNLPIWDTKQTGRA
jgi:hypothetical protein